MVDILETLRRNARQRARTCPRDDLILRGLSRTEYMIRLTDNATLFVLHYLLAQTVGLGCAYYDPAIEQPGLSAYLIGQNALDVVTESRSLNVAMLDAVFAAFKGPPSQSYCLSGTNIQKAGQRAELVCREALAVLKQRRAPKSGGSKMKVLNVGVVGDFLAILAGSGAEITATDFYEGVVGTHVHGVKVQHGSKTLELVAESDVAVVTGMTLTNNTLDAILSTALANQTSLVLFAETGAHFAEEYCRLGVDVVVSEPFPFYLSCHGTTRIDVYRRANLADGIEASGTLSAKPDADKNFPAVS